MTDCTRAPLHFFENSGRAIDQAELHQFVTDGAQHLGVLQVQFEHIRQDTYRELSVLEGLQAYKKFKKLRDHACHKRRASFSVLEGPQACKNIQRSHVS